MNERPAVSPPTDERIARDVRARLGESPYPDTQCLVVRCREGTVVLRGVVDSYYHRQIAQAVAQGVDGVRSVVDKISVQEAPTSTD